jgi:hypothetical protein
MIRTCRSAWLWPDEPHISSVNFSFILALAVKNIRTGDAAGAVLWQEASRSLLALFLHTAQGFLLALLRLPLSVVRVVG